ncbi:MAG: hypothetical protein ACT4OK_17435 [Gemmobacter sp.]
MNLWLVEQHPATLLVLWLLAGGLALGSLDRSERRWIFGIAALGLLGVGMLFATAFLVPVTSQMQALAVSGLIALAAFWGMIICALIGLARRLIAPPVARPTRHVRHPDDLAP